MRNVKCLACRMRRRRRRVKRSSSCHWVKRHIGFGSKGGMKGNPDILVNFGGNCQVHHVQLTKNKKKYEWTISRCLKITEKVSFNIYVYILSGHKLIKNAKNGPFWRIFDNLKLAVKQCYQTGHL